MYNKGGAWRRARTQPNLAAPQSPRPPKEKAETQLAVADGVEVHPGQNPKAS